MTPEIFETLTKRRQADLLQHDGMYLNTRQEPQFVIDLYRLNHFLVEVYTHKEEDKMVLVRSFYPNQQPPCCLPEAKIRYLYYHNYNSSTV